MSNPLYQMMGTPTPMDQLSQIKSNPLGFIRRAGYNIPEGIGSPQQMIQYLVQSGQIPQAKLNQAQSMANMFFRR